MVVIRDERNKTIRAVIVLFLSSLILVAYSSRNPQAARIGSAVLGEILAPVQGVFSSVYSWGGGLWVNTEELFSAREENQKLKEQLRVLEIENSRLLEVRYENKELRRILAFTEKEGLISKGKVNGVVANVISHDPSNWRQIVTVNKGAASGVKPDMPAVDGDGVVGIVISSLLSSSRVLLLTDYSSGVDAVVQSSRARGIVRGNGEHEAVWNFVLKEEEVKLGDRVITSGLGGVFPRGLLVGIVSQVKEDHDGGLFHRISIKPAVDVTKLETILILTEQEWKG